MNGFVLCTPVAQSLGFATEGQPIVEMQKSLIKLCEIYFTKIYERTVSIASQWAIRKFEK